MTTSSPEPTEQAVESTPEARYLADIARARTRLERLLADERLALAVRLREPGALLRIGGGA